MAQGSADLTTVLAPAASYLLSDVQSFKSELLITAPTDDDYIATLLAQASTAVMQYCNRVIPAELVMDEFWPQRDPYPFQVPGGVAPLQLSRWPIVPPVAASAAGVTPVVAAVAPIGVMENGTALVDGVDFRTDYRRGQLLRLNGVSYPSAWSPQYIAVTYTGGFVTIPNDLADVVTRMMRARWFARMRDPQIRSENIAGVYEATYWFGSGPGSSGGLPPDITAILDNYRVPVTA